MIKKIQSFALLSTLTLSQVVFSANGYNSSTVAPVPPTPSNGYTTPNNNYNSSQTPQAGGAYIPPQPNQPKNGYSSSQTPSQHTRQRHKTDSITFSIPGFESRVVIGPGHHVTVNAVGPFGTEWFDQTVGTGAPVNTVVGGGENGYPLFVCHAHYQGGDHPGKIVGGKCHITYAGRELAFNRYQVLVSNIELAWLPGSYGSLPAGAIQGGYENGHPLFICQTHYANGVHPGKLVGQNCNIGYAGKEISIPYYNVLVA